ncbi:MFS transporter [Legionella erythra]|uniref:Major facilitator superfamily (MFS) transporter n=1 Tax=Legionella erythra TaxID=448 RepID=A0A0W0TT62_LEGER|nr:MFS transporter [Legionella erythra]KTC98716.1 major facilitator superfamily (MFS) transporter [Legionella erythra]
MAAIFINQVGNITYIFLIPYATKNLGFPLSQAATVLLVFNFSMLLSSAISGFFIDKYGSHKILITSLICNGFTLLLFPMAKNYYHCICITLLWGFFYGLYRPSAQTLLTLLVPVESYKLIFIIYRFTLNIGMSIGPALGGYLALNYFSLVTIINGVANLVAASVLMVTLIKFINTNSSVSTNTAKIEFGLLKSNQAILFFLLSMLFVFMIFFQHQAPLVLFFENELHLPLNFYGLIFTINTLLIVFFELPLNFLMLKLNNKATLTIGASLIALGFAGFYFCTQKWGIVLMVTIWTLGEMVLFPAASSYIAENSSPNVRGKYMALYNTCINLGMLLGPWLGISVIQRYGYQNLWALCGALGLVSVCLFSYLIEPKRKFEPALNH